MAETTMSNQLRFDISGLGDVVSARRRGLEIALSLGFPNAEANKVAVVISELGRNIEQYAGEGIITLITYTGGETAIEIIAEDQGPGIENLDLVLEGGFSTSNGLGLGVSGSRLLMDEFEIETDAGKGTKITAMKRLRAH